MTGVKNKQTRNQPYKLQTMALFNIFRKGSSSFMSSILNVLGMAVAFAAFYIILVQVDYDLIGDPNRF